MILLSVAGLHRLQQGGCHRLQRGTDKGRRVIRDARAESGREAAFVPLHGGPHRLRNVEGFVARALNDLQRDRGFALKQAAQCVGIGPYLDADDVGSACGERLQIRAFVDIEIDMEPFDQTIVVSDVTPPAT